MYNMETMRNGCIDNEHYEQDFLLGHAYTEFL
jgi:hypothetical protein